MVIISVMVLIGLRKGLKLSETGGGIN